MQTWNSWQEWLGATLGASLGKTVGSTAAMLIQALLYVLFVYLVWGLPWQRILWKAGFKDSLKTILFWMLVSPMLLAPLAQLLTNDANQFLATLSGGALYLAILAIALIPSSSRGKTS